MTTTEQQSKVKWPIVGQTYPSRAASGSGARKVLWTAERPDNGGPIVCYEFLLDGQRLHQTECSVESFWGRCAPEAPLSDELSQWHSIGRDLIAWTRAEGAAMSVHEIALRAEKLLSSEAGK